MSEKMNVNQLNEEELDEVNGGSMIPAIVEDKKGSRGGMMFALDTTTKAAKNVKNNKTSKKLIQC